MVFFKLRGNQESLNSELIEKERWLLRLQSPSREGEKYITVSIKSTLSTRSHSRTFHHKSWIHPHMDVPARWLGAEPHFDATRPGSNLINRCTMHLLQNIRGVEQFAWIVGSLPLRASWYVVSRPKPQTHKATASGLCFSRPSHTWRITAWK